MSKENDGEIKLPPRAGNEVIGGWPGSKPELWEVPNRKVVSGRVPVIYVNSRWKRTNRKFSKQSRIPFISHATKFLRSHLFPECVAAEPFRKIWYRIFFHLARYDTNVNDTSWTWFIPAGGSYFIFKDIVLQTLYTTPRNADVFSKQIYDLEPTINSKIIVPRVCIGAVVLPNG